MSQQSHGLKSEDQERNPKIDDQTSSLLFLGAAFFITVAALLTAVVIASGY